MFGLGAHPAFKCDYTNGKYSIEFDEKEDNIEILQLEDGLISNKKIEVSEIIKDNRIKLNSESFINDAIIMKNICVVKCQAENIKLSGSDQSLSVDLQMEG